MKKTAELVQALQFYVENDLTEVFSEKKQNHFLENDKVKNNILPKEEKKEIAVNNFVKPVFSTSDAIGNLAKKFYDTQNNLEEDLAKKTQNTVPINDADKYFSLNEIVAKAKNLAKSCSSLPALRAAVEGFDGCNLKKMATNTVFCDGNSNSKVMVIGEAPGNHEDLQGIPFCGDSGKVLDAMFRAINMTRKDNFYITNVIFWRPPGNRRPTDEELAICRPFVERHIELFDPQVLVLVGATAMSAVLGINDPVSNIRGRFIDFSPKFLNKTIKTFTIFHPSYLMRQSAKKKVAWQDMLELERFLKN